MLRPNIKHKTRPVKPGAPGRLPRHGLRDVKRNSKRICRVVAFGPRVKQKSVANVVAGVPSILGLRIEQNLEPTVQWLLDLGLSQGDVAKAVAASPWMLEEQFAQESPCMFVSSATLGDLAQ